MKLPRNPLDISYMSEKEVDARIKKGLNDVEKGKCILHRMFLAILKGNTIMNYTVKDV